MDLWWNLQVSVNLFFQSLGGWLNPPMQFFTFLGREEFFVAAMPALYWCIDAALGARIAAILLLSAGVNNYLKIGFRSPRPYWLNTQVKALSPETSFGLPSGHAQLAASVWGVAAGAFKQKGVKATFVALIFLIGLSRIYLGAHLIGDVLGGWLVGGLILWAYLRWERPLLAWAKNKSLAAQLLLSFASAMLILLINFALRAAIGNYQLPQAWLDNALAAAPGVIPNPMDPTEIYTLAGMWFGFSGGLAWLWHVGGFSARGSIEQRFLRYLVGALGVAILYAGLGAIFPHDASAIGLALRFLRYILVGAWITAAAPLLFIRLGLAERGAV